MNPMTLIFGATLLAMAMGCRPGLKIKNPEARPYKDKSERLHFMLTMAAELLPGGDNQCIDELHRRLDKKKKVSHSSPAPAPPIHNQSLLAQQKPLLLAQEGIEAGESACGRALSGCGNCHLPQVNNCDYEIWYKKGDIIHVVTAKVAEISKNSITITQKIGEEVQEMKFSGDDALEKSSFRRDIIRSKTRLRHNQIVKSIWKNGADPIETWWHFKHFGKKGKVAKKMLALAAENDVACTNCHMRHGDFRLTEAGQHFKNTGKVIKRVPLSKFKAKR